MKKNPIVIFTGLAVAAVAGVAGLTRDQWMGHGPAAIEKAAEAPSAGQSSETKQPESQQAEAPAATTTQQATQPAAEQPAAEPPAAAATEEQPAAPSAQQQTAEQPVEAPATQQQQAAAPAAEQPAAAPQPEQPTVEAAQPPAAPQPEAPASAAAEQPAAEQPAEQPASQQAEQPAPQETQQAAIQPQPDQPAAQAPAPEQPQQVAEPPKEEPPPTFDTVRVEKSGEAVIAGRAQPGDQVDVKLNGETIGSATANSDGSFVVVPEQPLPAGSGSLTIEAKGQNEAASSTSEQTVAIIVPEQAKDNALVAVVSPNEPTKVLQKPQPAETVVAKTEPGAAEEPAAAAKPKPVSLDAIDYDAAGNIVFSGQGQAGTAARIYVDNAVVGDAAIGDDGRWVFSGTTQVAPGTHSLRIDGIDGAGKVLSRIEAPFFREETAKVASAPAAEKSDSEIPAAAAGSTEGQTIAEAAPAAQQAPKGPKEGRLIIQPGNNLWRISKVIYGDGLKYAMLYEANKDQIRDPDLIYPGQVFRTPEVNPPETIDPTARDAMVESSTQ